MLRKARSTLHTICLLNPICLNRCRRDPLFQNPFYFSIQRVGLSSSGRPKNNPQRQLTGTREPRREAVPFPQRDAATEHHQVRPAAPFRHPGEIHRAPQEDSLATIVTVNHSLQRQLFGAVEREAPTDSPGTTLGVFVWQKR